MSALRCLHIGAFDAEGGAARSQYRLHRAMLQAGMESDILCLSRSSGDPRAHEAGGHLGARADGASLPRRAVMAALRSGAVPGAGGSFNLALPGVDVSDHPLVKQAEVLMLHWVDEMLSPPGVSRLLATGKSVAWLLHDQWPMTGGCHYSGSCRGYLEDCGDCPQVAAPLRPLAHAWLGLKRAAFSRGRMTVVAPSRWLAECSRRSALFASLPTRVIPYALDTTTFCPKAGARRRLGLPEDALVVLHTAWRNEERKGTDQLSAVLRACLEHPAMSAAASRGRFYAVCIGRGMAQAALPGVKSLLPGFVGDDACLADYYRASDAFLLPSMQDNLPNTMLESMACATPVVAFGAGGIPDFVQSGVTGRLAAPGDARGLGRALAELLADTHGRRSMGLKARELVERECSYTTAASRYVDFFRELSAMPCTPEAAAPCSTVLEHSQLLESFQQQALGVRLDAACREDQARRAVHQAFATHQDGHVRQALELLAPLAGEESPDPDLLRSRGALLAVSGRTADALATFDRCLELAPDLLDLHLNKADALRYAGRHDESLALLDGLEALNPLAAGLWLKRGQALLEMGRHVPAARACIREIRTHGGDAARSLLKRCLRERCVPAQPQ